MSQSRVLNRDGTFAAAEWSVVRDAVAVVGEREPVLLPLALYLVQPQPTANGVWLSPTDDPAVLIPTLETLPLIAIDFPVFNDGRGYSTAAVLRSRYRYRGDLRAIGDVLIDQLFFLRRAGISSFVLRADQDRDMAVAKLKTFSDAYQGAADDPRPAFRRHARPNARELEEQDK